MIGVRVSNDGARAFEESLNEVVQQSQNTLEQVKQQKLRQQEVMISSGWNSAGLSLSTPGYPLTQNTRQQTPSRVNRPASASRTPRSNQNQQASIVSKSLEDPQEQSANKTQNVNQAISRKMGLFEDQHLSEGQKAEKRNYHSLREQIAGLKTRIELLMSQEELRGKISSSHSQTATNMLNLDSDWLQELIAQRVSREVNRAVTEAMATASSHHHRGATISPSRVVQATINSNQQQQEQVSTLEKEILRLTSDFERLRSKQVYLDRIYSELKESLSQRDTRLEEAHKKQLQSYRNDFDLLQNSSKKVIQEITQTIDIRTLEIQSLHDKHTLHVENISSILAELDLRLLTTSSSLQTVSNHVSMLKNNENETSNRLTDLEQSLPMFLTEIEKIFGLRHALAEVMTRVDTQTENLDTQTSQIKSLTNSLDSLGVKMKEKLENLEEKCELKLQFLQSQHETAEQHQEKTVSEIQQSLHHIQSQHSVLSSDVYSLQSTREELKSAMSSYNTQIEEEASRAFALTVTLQRLQTGQESLELEVDKLTKDHHMHISDMTQIEDIQHQLDLFSAQQALTLATLEGKLDDLTQPVQMLELGLEGLQGRVLVVETRLDDMQQQREEEQEQHQATAVAAAAQAAEEEVRSVHSKSNESKTSDNTPSSPSTNAKGKPTRISSSDSDRSWSPKKPNAPKSSTGSNPSSPSAPSSRRHHHTLTAAASPVKAPAPAPAPSTATASAAPTDSKYSQEQEEEQVNREEVNKGALSAINSMLETANFHVHALTVHLAMQHQQHQQHTYQQQPSQLQSPPPLPASAAVPLLAPTTPAAALTTAAAVLQLPVPVDYGFADFKREFNFNSLVPAPSSSTVTVTAALGPDSASKQQQQLEADPVIERATRLLARLTAIEEDEAIHQQTQYDVQAQAEEEEQDEEEEEDTDAIMMADLPSEHYSQAQAEEAEDIDLFILGRLADEDIGYDDNNDEPNDDENLSHHSSWDHIEFASQDYGHESNTLQPQVLLAVEENEAVDTIGDELQALLQRQRLARQQRQPEIFGLQAFRAADEVLKEPRVESDGKDENVVRK